MLVVTTDSVSERKIIKTLGFVKGSTIRTKHIGKDILAGLKNIAGGELNEYNEMMIEARQIAIGRMTEDAKALGANAIVGVRISSASVMNGAAEMVAYGTAVILED